MSWYKINREFCLDRKDIGEVVCVKVYKYKYNFIKWYQNCLILDIIYIDNHIRPDRMLVLKDDGKILSLNISYVDEVEVKYNTGKRSFRSTHKV